MYVKMNKDGDLQMKSTGKLAVEQQGAVILAQIKARTIQRLGLYVLAASLVVAASLMVVFAPEGREGVASIIGLALVVAAAGSAGYGKFGVKISSLSADFE
jgi:hypothetical protein